MRILVTGGAGYIGSASVEAFLAAGHEVTVLDDLSTGHRGAVPAGAALVVGSYGDGPTVRALLSERRIDAVLHCAAKSVVSESMREPAMYYRENVAGGIALLEAMREAGVGRIVFSSTAAVYGRPDETPIQEDAAIRPINAYGETKRTVEGAITWYCRAYGFRGVVLRYFNAAGATGALGEWHDPETHLIPNVFMALEEGRELVVFGDDYETPDGSCVRDYISVVDIAQAHLLALAATDPADPRCGPADGPTEPVVCNLGNGRGFSNLEVVRAAGSVTGRLVSFRIGPRRAGDPATLLASGERARAVLGWQPEHSALDELLESAWTWRRAHPGGYPE